MESNQLQRGEKWGSRSKAVVLLVVAFVTGALTVHPFFQQSNVSVRELSSTTAQKKTTARAAQEVARDADGCYHVFLDVGANIGVHGRFLLEPEKYPDASFSRKLFRTHFGEEPRDNRDVCTFEFEPNPAHQAALQNKSVAYEAMGWRYHVMHFGASDIDGTMDFFHQGDTDHEEWGFSVKQFGAGSTKVSVPVIRFSKWLEEHVNKRKIPSTPHGSYGDSAGPKVIMKVDVEGTEYAMLPDLMLSGAMCGIDIMFGEFHPKFAPLDFPGQRIPLSTEVETREFQGALTKVIPSSRNCNTVFLMADDEQYLHDGMPLPVPDTA